jgi:hypothetical protein
LSPYVFTSVLPPGQSIIKLMKSNYGTREAAMSTRAYAVSI